MISESMARRFWPDGNAIGPACVWSRPHAPLNDIVGIVGDVRNDRTRPEADRWRIDRAADRRSPIMTFLIRTDRRSADLADPWNARRRP